MGSASNPSSMSAVVFETSWSVELQPLGSLSVRRWGSSVDFGSCRVDRPQFFGYGIGQATDSTIAFLDTQVGPSLAGIFVVELHEGSDISLGETHVGPATVGGILVGETTE